MENNQFKKFSLKMYFTSSCIRGEYTHACTAFDMLSKNENFFTKEFSMMIYHFVAGYYKAEDALWIFHIFDTIIPRKPPIRLSVNEKFYEFIHILCVIPCNDTTYCTAYLLLDEMERTGFQDDQHFWCKYLNESNVTNKAIIEDVSRLSFENRLIVYKCINLSYTDYLVYFMVTQLTDELIEIGKKRIQQITNFPQRKFEEIEEIPEWAFDETVSGKNLKKVDVLKRWELFARKHEICHSEDTNQMILAVKIRSVNYAVGTKLLSLENFVIYNKKYFQSTEEEKESRKKIKI